MRPSPPSRQRAGFGPRLAAIFVGSLLAILLPVVGVAAHAELDVPTPTDGATVTGTPPVIGATYTETLDPDGSSLILVDASGAEIARGGVVTTAEPTKEMSIADVPQLAPGEYTVKSTTKSAADGDVDRKTWTFTVVAAATPSPSPTPSPTVGAASPSTPPASPAPTPTITTAVATPAPSPDTGATSGSGTDVILPIVLGLIIVGVVAAALTRRRGGGSPVT